MENIEGEYHFKIWKENGWYLAQDEERGVITQGKSEEEIFFMLADAYCCVNEIPSSKWDRFWHRLLNLK